MMKMIAAHSQRTANMIDGVGVIPVLVVDDVAVAVDIAKVLVDAGLPVLEVTLRTTNALQVMEKMAAVDGVVLAAGTVLSAAQVRDCQSAGAQLLVSPGYTETLAAAALDVDVPLLPGAVTASEVMRLAELGFNRLKFFPAEASGGVAALKSFQGPLSQVSFCPTGGISRDNVSDYLSLSNVVCAGGSWIITAQDVQQRDWSAIKRKALASKIA